LVIVVIVLKLTEIKPCMAHRLKHGLQIIKSRFEGQTTYGLQTR